MREGQMASGGSPQGAWICYSSPVVKSSVSTLIPAPATNSSQLPSNMSCIPQKLDYHRVLPASAFNDNHSYHSATWQSITEIYTQP